MVSKCLVLAVALFVACQAYAPNPTPSAVISYATSLNLMVFDVNVTYVTDAQTLYMYDFSFTPWTSCSSVYTPSICNIRSLSQFNLTQGLPWNTLFAHDASSGVDATAIDGRYTGWPVPSHYWTLSLLQTNRSQGGDGATVAYRGLFSLDKIAACGGPGAVAIDVSSNYISYAGTFYVTWVQPALAPNPASQLLTAKYATISYTFPFVIQVPRQSGSVTGQQPLPYSILATLLNVQVVPDADSQNVLMVTILTRAPPSVNPMTLALLNFNDVTFMGVTSATVTITSPRLYLNASLSSQGCTIDYLDYCDQTWVLGSQPQPSLVFNGSYSVNFVIQQCNTSDTWQCVATSSTCSVSLSVGTHSHVTQVNTVSPFASTVVFYTDNSFRTVRTSNLFESGDVIHVKQTAQLGAIDPNFYTLDADSLWLCAPVPGGRAPFVGYDATLGMNRYGCSQPESINGVVNIPAANIVRALGSGQELLPSTFPVNSTRPATFT